MLAESRSKSRTFARSQVRIPSGKTVTHYSRRKNARPQCAGCGDFLKGVPRAFPSELHNIPKTQRRPQRPYGGVLCSSCSRQTIIDRVRNVFSLSKK